MGQVVLGMGKTQTQSIFEPGQKIEANSNPTPCMLDQIGFNVNFINASDLWSNPVKNNPNTNYNKHI